MDEKVVRLGVIGLGIMGTTHANYLKAGEIKGCKLTAVCDVVAKKTEAFPDAKAFTNYKDLISSGEVDAVLIATPHYMHTPIGIEALKAGLHVLVEKPISVHIADAQRLIDAHSNPKQVFSAMFMLRTRGAYKKIKQLIDEGELGELIRVSWIVTNWFRSEAYYKSSDWRATWEGEGGGVLVNQCPHNLDLLQWLLGMPSRVRAFCGIGKFHNVEVEDQVTAYLEYPNGASGTFITTTGEAPGTNRLEIAGTRGKLVLENDKIHFTRNEIPVDKFIKTTEKLFGSPEVWQIEIPITNSPINSHRLITQNFVDAILKGTELVAPAEDGINSVQLANAILYSSMKEETVEMPLDGAAFEKLLKGLIEKSKKEKK